MRTNTKEKRNSLRVGYRVSDMCRETDVHHITHHAKQQVTAARSAKRLGAPAGRVPINYQQPEISPPAARIIDFELQARDSQVW